MKKINTYYLIIFVFLIFSCQDSSMTNNNYDSQLQALFDEEWTFRMQESPFFASSIGVTDYDDQLPLVGEQEEKRRAEYWQSILDRLAKIDRSQLSKDNQVNYDIFKFQLEDLIAQVGFQTYLIPISAEGGFHVDFMYMMNDMPFQNVKDYENYIQRLKGFKKYTQAHIQLMKQGIEKKLVLPKIILKDYDQTMNNYITTDPESHLFYSPFKKMPTTINASQQTSLKDLAKTAINESIVPAFQEFQQFLKTQYIPNASEKIGASALPNGSSYYAQRVQYFATLPLSADEIYEIGQQEVDRIKTEMLEVIKAVKFKGSFADFLNFLRTDPQFYATSPKELLSEASYLAKKMDGKLPDYFNKLPSLPYGVIPVPDAIAPNYTAGRYSPGSIKNNKAGNYLVNTYKLESRPLYALPALTLHEAVPGHHLQISLSQELDLPAFRKHSYISSYGEGWALYCEWLGKEAGIYEDAYSDFGRLTYEMWRACRLVVDVGLHAKGWSRDKAIDYLASNTALSLHEVNTEIDRYIGWPAQALSYKLGELKIKELRKKAEKTLGSDFDIREFHDLILSFGSVPLFVLEKLVTNYINDKATKL